MKLFEHHLKPYELAEDTVLIDRHSSSPNESFHLRLFHSDQSNTILRSRDFRGEKKCTHTICGRCILLSLIFTLCNESWN